MSTGGKVAVGGAVALAAGALAWWLWPSSAAADNQTITTIGVGAVALGGFITAAIAYSKSTHADEETHRLYEAIDEFHIVRTALAEIPEFGEKYRDAWYNVRTRIALARQR